MQRIAAQQKPLPEKLPKILREKKSSKSNESSDSSRSGDAREVRKRAQCSREHHRKTKRQKEKKERVGTKLAHGRGNSGFGHLAQKRGGAARVTQPVFFFSTGTLIELCCSGLRGGSCAERLRAM